MKFAQKIWLVLAVLLTACGSDQGDDLDRFMQEAGQGQKAKIEPLPEVKPYTPLEYNSDAVLHDPFKPRKTQSVKATGIQPDFNRPKEPLEAYPLESLKYVGSLSKETLEYALIKTPDNNVQQVTIGNYIGQNFGIVTDINEAEVQLKEIVQDSASGDWIEQSASIALQE